MAKIKRYIVSYEPIEIHALTVKGAIESAMLSASEECFLSRWKAEEIDVSNWEKDLPSDALIYTIY